jgi:single-stranded DNA-binding protein
MLGSSVAHLLLERSWHALELVTKTGTKDEPARRRHTNWPIPAFFPPPTLSAKPAMLSVLIEGTLIGAPVRRTSSKGSTFVTVQMRCTGDNAESVFCSVIAFQASAADPLAALAAGDTVAVAGPAALSQWEKNGEHRVGLKVTATRVLTVYEAGMRRKAASADREPRDDGRPPAPLASPERSRQCRHLEAPAQSSRLVDWDNDEPV